MKIELWPIDRVIPYPRNPRKVPQSAIDKVAASLAEFGWRQPLVTDTDGVLIVGATRRLAAQKLRMDRVPVHVAEGLTPAQIREYRLMDNRSHQETDWDIEVLTLQMAELKALDLDLSFTGFEPREIDDARPMTTRKNAFHICCPLPPRDRGSGEGGGLESGFQIDRPGVI